MQACKKREVTDATVRAWHRAARAGDEEGLERLSEWAYMTANRYFQQRMHVEAALQQHDVDELTSRFYETFLSVWPKARDITHYTRRLLSLSVRRFIGKRRRAVAREVPRSPHQLVELAGSGESTVKSPWLSWTDEEWRRYATVIQVYFQSDVVTQSVVASRLKNPPISYRDLSKELGMTEAALRMRLTRFGRAVRTAYETMSTAAHIPTMSSFDRRSAEMLSVLPLVFPSSEATPGEIK